jgi:cysteine-rich repeat protein
MERRRIAAVAACFMVLLAAGCEGSESVGASSAALAPAGSNAAFISNTVPTVMAPGEKRAVQVVVQNTGTTPGTNDWNTSYRLRTVGTSFGWSSVFLTSTVTTGSTTTFSFVITAPATVGTSTFGARMMSPDGSFFGPTLNVSVNVSSATTPFWRCAYEPTLSTVPTTIASGATALVTLVVRNTGSQSWVTPGQVFSSVDSPPNLWFNTVRTLSSAVAPGATTTFTFSIVGPSTTGTLSLKRQMNDTRAPDVGGVGLFSSTPCVDVPITVTGASTAALNASLVSQDFPATLAPGEARTVTVVMQNTGSEAWTGGSTYVLASQNSPASLWGTTLASLSADTAPGANGTFVFTVTAPTTPGSYRHVWRMRKVSGTNAGLFGPTLDFPATVDGAATPALGATVASQTIPLLITAGATVTFQVVMTNSGSGNWTGSAFRLVSANSPSSLWNITSSALGATETVAAGATRTFNLSVRAPSAAGTYTSAWRMSQSPGVGSFGATATTTGIVVTTCGNGVIDAGEQCDDSNLIDGDGCTPACLFPAAVRFDASTDSDRTLIGSQALKALAAVGAGDVTGDGVPEIIVGENRNFVPMTGSSRNQAGSVYGYAGGAGFFAASSTVPTGAIFTIAGASANDSLGATNASGIVATADVTGDGINDLVVSAQGGDGLMNARVDAGEVYVIRGGTALATAGLIDLAASPASPLLVATIIGAVAGDGLILLGAGSDLTGDGVSDLVIGAPGNDTGGSGAGAVYVVAGGTALTGNVDLAAPGAVSVFAITGADASDGMGRVAAIGNIGSTASADLLIGIPNRTTANGSSSGAAFAFFGPITSNLTLAEASVSWLGAGANDKFGAAVAIGNVGGTSDADAIIGATQQRRAGLQTGAVDVWTGPLASATGLQVSSANMVVLGLLAGDTMGTALTVGDMNNDGIGDIAIGVGAGDGVSGGRVNAGEAYVVTGRATLPATYDLTVRDPAIIFYGAVANDRLGTHPNNIALVDIDADNRADLCVGSFRGGTGAVSNPGRIDCIASPL